jgi:hypothetical protein
VTRMLPEQTGDGNAYKLRLFMNENNSGLTKNLTLMHKYPHVHVNVQSTTVTG